jgi:OMF family outer membrane factor
MTLGASLVVLTPSFTVNAQDASTNPTTYIPASRISQQQLSSNAGLNNNANFNDPKQQEIGKLSAVPTELNLKEIHTVTVKPLPIAPHHTVRLIMQMRRASELEPATEQSVPQSALQAQALEPPKALQKTPIAGKIPAASAEQTKGKPQPAVLANSKQISDRPRILAAPLQETLLPRSKPVTVLKQDPIDLATEAIAAFTPTLSKLVLSNVQSSAKPLLVATNIATKKIDRPTSETKLANNSVAALPAVASTTVDRNSLEIDELAPKPQSETKSSESASPTNTSTNAQVTKVAIGLDPRQPLIVPTTPSQVKIERTQPITLKEALDLSDRNSPTIAQARIAVERAKAQLEEALAARNPTVDAQATYNYSNSATTQASNIAQSPFFQSSPISQTLQGQVGVNYNLYTSGQVDANIRVAENTLRSAEADFNRIAQTTRLSIATAYYNAQNADGQVRIRDQQVTNAQRSLQDTEALERAGVGTKFDVLQSQVQLANAKQTLSNAKAQQTITRRELARQLSYPSNLALLPSDEIKPVDDWKLGLEETILLAYKNRSELDVQRLQREVASDRAKAALARLGPQVSLFANLDQFDNLRQVGGVALGYSLGATVRWSIFDGGVANAVAKQAEADRALAESRFTQAGDQARFDVESAYNNLKATQEQIESTTLAVKQATEALRLSRLRLSAGVGTQLEVLRSEDDLTQADVNRLNAIVGYNLALVQLQRAINGL